MKKVFRHLACWSVFVPLCFGTTVSCWDHDSVFTAGKLLRVDADELRRRSAEANRLRKIDGKARLPETSRLLGAMEAGLPASTGVALGFDRVVMLAAGAESLDEVIAFPFERA